jgi:hypothetical protein
MQRLKRPLEYWRGQGHTNHTNHSKGHNRLKNMHLFRSLSPLGVVTVGLALGASCREIMRGIVV